MRVDYHTHTDLCKHADGHLEDYIRHAVSIGLQQIGCSDHAPMPAGFDDEHRMNDEQFGQEYKPDLFALKERYRGTIDVKAGIEADFYPGTEAWTNSFLTATDFDYVIGSVHFLGEWGFDNPVFVHKYDEQDIDVVYQQYYDHIKRSAQAGLFDILGHCDLVKKFGHRPAGDLTAVLREVMSVVKQSGMAVEINTSGLRKPVHEVYPGDAILSLVKELEIPVTIGSDAHTPADVGRDFETAKALAGRYAGGRVSIYTRRERSEVRL
ncbi:MAG: histidinol-phosphatase HisJ [Ignavibacteriales bacterium]|nr:histidinol-phosphatase HisJ [Ignavibacteriales bacterium]